jgi:hypothetical protein
LQGFAIHVDTASNPNRSWLQIGHTIVYQTLDKPQKFRSVIFDTPFQAVCCAGQFPLFALELSIGIQQLASSPFHPIPQDLFLNTPAREFFLTKLLLFS